MANPDAGSMELLVMSHEHVDVELVVLRMRCLNSGPIDVASINC